MPNRLAKKGRKQKTDPSPFNLIFDFVDQIFPKIGYFESKTETMNIPIESFIFELV